MEIKLPMILDGAMGTMLQRSGMKPGTIPETLNITDPETVAAIHRAYFRAGSRIVYANTFGANSLKLKDSGYSLREVIAAGVRIAKECAAEAGGLAGLDVGPLGVMVEPMGSLAFEEAVRLYREMMEAGAEAGADMIAIETMSDLAETRAALLAAKEATNLPVFVTMSFDSTGRTFTGCTPASMARTLEGLGADAVGVNCSLGPKEMIPIIREIRENTALPVIAKPNAGLPDPVTGAYGVDAAEFAAAMRELADAGAGIVGGCCGTDPEYIRALAEEMNTKGPCPCAARAVPGAVCTGPVCLRTDRIRVIGERINPTGKKRMQQALLEDDIDYLVEMAIRQADAGADLLDVNVGYPGVDEVKMLPRAVQAIQAATDLPLQLDSTNPEALEAALRVYSGKAAVNSVNGKEESLRTVLPLVKKYGAAVVGLTLDEDGIPDTAEKRLAIAEKILERAAAIGISREDVWIDCLTLTVSAQQEQAKETLKAVRMVTEKLGLRTVLGVSNISFGLPNRLLVTGAFLTAALEAGLTMPIVNPNQKEIMDIIAARRVLCGEDEGCRAYVERFAEETPEAKAPAAAAGMTLGEAIRRGLRNEAGRLTAEMLGSRKEMEIVEKELIPALEKTGEGYEQGKVFLPQLLSAAQAAQSAFEEIRGSLLKKGEKGADRGELIMATVQGDIHDIGKNIVITVLENYGYRVRDLGRDVPPETVVREAAERKIRLVGLSALRTTTLLAMAETVRQLKTLPDPPQVMVGGAVVTEDYAKSIGADWYAKDVRDAVKITERVFSGR